jgi:hypothetical chaperone protein
MVNEATIGVGVDFGTSNSTVAWFDGQEIFYVQLEARGPIMPTAIHLNRNYQALTGARAVEQYVEENRARLVELVPEVIGVQATAIGDGKTRDAEGAPENPRNVVYGPLVDRGMPGRLFLGLKRLLGHPQPDRLRVFDRPYRLVALITPILMRMRESVEDATRRALQRVHIGRPVQFEGQHRQHNDIALRRLSEGSTNAGFRDIQFYPEPIAATLSYLWQAKRQAKLAKRGIALTVDFGGGTLDLSVLRYDGLEFEVLATAGTGLGGDRIDQLIFRELLFPHLGKGESWSRMVDGRMIETPFPFEDYEEGLLNWAITHLLNQNQYKARLTTAIANAGEEAVKFERLKDVINYNYSHNIFRAIRQAKAELSSVEETVVDIPEINVRVPFTRKQFDAMLADVLKSLDDLIMQVLDGADLTAAQIDVVIRTGGSSLIVAVKDLLDSRFPDKVTEHDPFTSVAGGLAVANYHGYEWAERAKE